LVLPMLAVAGLAVFFITSALGAYTGGVQDTGKFRLNGKTLPTTCGPPDTWAALYTVGGSTPCSSDGFVFVHDGVGSEDSTFWSGGGSKDAYDPALGPWMWSPTDVAPDKDDIDNAFAAAYHLTDATGATTRFLFFGADRFATSGDAQMGFWFLQSNVCLAGPVSGTKGSCPSTTPNQTANAGKFVDPATGVPVHHKNGDLLILVNFNKGGTLGLAGVFKWTGANGAGAGEVTPVLFGNGADCKTITDPNNFCATASTENLPGDPVWPYKSKGVTGQASYGASSLIEGGVNLNAIPGAGTCFPTFIAETRSSSGPETGLSLQAQLKDIAFGQFHLCKSRTVTTPVESNGTTPIPPTGVSVGTGSSGVDVKDQATVTVTGASTFGGSVTFHLCGPSATSSTETCDKGGYQVGTPQSITQATTMPITSSAAHLTRAGRYCWRADYSGDSSAGVPESSDHSATECFLVNPVTPTLGTQAVDAAGRPITSAVPFGQAVYDTAALAGTAYRPGTGGGGTDGSIDPTARTTAAQGTITFRLYGPDKAGSVEHCGTLAKEFPAKGIEVAVNGDNTYGGPSSTPPVSFIPQAPGVYHWKAEYSGDLPNTNSQTHNGDCSDAGENVTVLQEETTTTTRQFVFPQDKAKIVSSGGASLQGAIKFKLFDSLADCKAATATGLLFSEEHAISGASPQYSTTSNATFRMTSGTATPVYWNVVYESKNTVQLGSSSTCSESTAVTFAGDDSGITIP
jgi:hypothetical protein